MLGSIYIGLSGMNAYSRGLQTISNNVANLNSSGFKATQTKFTDLFSYGGGGLSYKGQIDEGRTGNGVSFAAPRIDFSQGDLRQSDGDLDLAIQGSGFLILLNGDTTFYARTGQFSVDKDGYVVKTGTQYRLAVLNGANRPEAVRIDGKRTNAPSPTTTIVFSDNLSSAATSATVADIAVYDSNGAKHAWKASFAKSTTNPAEWTATITDETGATLGTGTLTFTNGVIDPSTAKIVINTAPTNAAPLAVTLDFSTGVTAFSSGTSSTLRTSSVDGNGVGALTTVQIDNDGHIKLNYTNGKTDTLGAVAIADFRDPQGLRRLSDGLFDNMGLAPDRLLASGKDGIGRLESKQIEASNVNLSDEFGELILIQRGFQASSQVVSVANDMIQQLFGIRGQG